MPWIKTFEVGIEDLFSAGARGWRRSRGLSVPQSNSSKFLGRIGMFFYDLPDASKDAWDYFWRNKPVEEIPFHFAGGKDEIWRIQTGRESPLVVLDNKIGELMTTSSKDPSKIEKAMKGLAMLTQYTLKGLDRTVGFKRLRAMDIMLRNTMTPSSIRAEIVQNLSLIHI